MEQCSFCGNKNLKNTLTDYTYRHGSDYMIFHNVPAVQCEYCGEKYYTSRTLKQIEAEYQSIKSGAKTAKEIRVPVEDFSQLDVA